MFGTNNTITSGITVAEIITGITEKSYNGKKNINAHARATGIDSLAYEKNKLLKRELWPENVAVGN